MKLHLPVRLFRAIIALMVFVPMTSSPSICAEEEPVRVYVNQISDLDDAISGNYLYILNSNIEGSLYYIQETSNVVITSALSDSSPSYYVSLEGNNYDSSLPRFSVADFSFDNLASLTFSNFRTKPKEVNISDSGLTSSSAKGSQESYGAIQVNKFAIKDIEDNVTFQGNVASSYVKASAETTSYGYMTWTATARAEALTQGGSVCAISGIDIAGNSADISFSENIATAYSYASATCTWQWTGAKSYATSLAQAKGGALCGPVININGNTGTVSFLNNKSEATGNTYVYAYGTTNMTLELSAYGGAIYGTTVNICSNAGNIELKNNIAKAFTEARGGAIYAANLKIQNNGDVLFSGNTSSDGKSDAFYASQLCLSAPGNHNVSIYDSFYVNGKVELNCDYDTIPQTGDICLYGKTATVLGSTNLCNGKLVIADGADYQGLGFTVKSSASSVTTLCLNNGALSQNSNNVVFLNGTNLSLSGLNTIKSSSLEMKDGSIWSFDLSSTHLTSAALTYTGSLTLGGKLTINLNSEESLEEGRYALLTLVSATAPTSCWTSDNIIINAEEGMSASWDNLYWDDNTLYYLSSSYPVGTLVWTGSDDMNWNAATQNWKINEVAALYSNSKDVIFSDQGAGEVTITANYAPKSVLVENAAGKDYSFIGTGYMSGAMTLTKRGEGSLMLATANTYTGGTIIEAGKVVLGHIMGLGTGPVSLTGGTLDFATYAATNIVNASAGMVCGSAFNGTLNVAGDLTLGDNFKANTIVLNTGSLSGGNIVGTTIEAYDGVIMTSISADSRLYANGKVSVLSVPSFSGVVAAKDGAELSFENTGLSYSGNDLSGLLLYSLDSTISIKECTVNFLNNKGETTKGIILANVSNGKGGNIVFEDNDAILFLNNESRSNANYGNAGSGVAYCGEKSSLLFKDNTNVTFKGNRAIHTSTNGSAVAGAVNVSQTSKFEMIENTLVEFDGNYASAASNGNAKGGAVWCQGEMYVVDNESVIFKGNYAAGKGAPGQGGAIGGPFSSSISLNNNGSVAFIGNTASSSGSSGSGGAISGDNIELSNNGSVTFSGNTASGFSASGGAIYGDTITLSNNGSVTFSGSTAMGTPTEGGVWSCWGGAIYFSTELIITGNALGVNKDGSAQQLLFEHNHATDCFASSLVFAEVHGGAINSRGIHAAFKINNNGESVFRGNYVHGKYSADGGAIYKRYGIFSIQNNASVVFEKNYTLQEETLRLQSIYAFDSYDASEEMLVNFSAPKGGKIEFRDSIHIEVDSNSASAFHLNNWYINDDEEKVAQTGDIIFTGEDATAENLKAILAEHDIHREASADEIRLSKTSEVGGTMQLHDGRLIARDGAIIAVDGITVHGSASGLSTPTLWLDNGELRPHLNFQQNAIWISGGSALHLSRQNTARYSTLTLSAGSTLIIDVAAAHTTTAALTLNYSTLSLGGTITLQLNAAEGLNTAGRYMLLSGVSEPTDWASHITVSGGVWTIDALSWVGDTLYLNYPTLTEATWNNASEDWVWNVDSSVNWEQHELNWAYRNGIGVIFGDEACGTVKLAGNLAPKSVLVNNSIGKDYVFSGTGSLTDSMKLTKEGTGKLTIQTANSYTGGTEIKGGVLVVDNTKALGTGEVVLNGGTLEIAVTGLANTLANTGTSTLKVSNGKTHSLAGTIDNSGELTLEGLFDATALATVIAQTHIDANGQEGNSGFLKTAGMEVDIMSGSGTLVNNGTVSIDGTTVVLSSDGYGKIGAELQLGTYTIVDGTHSVAAILDRSSSADIILNAGGTLTADSSTDALTTTGGVINMNEAIELGGSISGAVLNVSAGKLTATLEGENTLNATGWLLNQTITNNGTLNLTGTVDATALATAIAQTHIDANGQEGNSGFLKTAGMEVDIMSGSGTLVNNGTVSIDGTTVTLDDKGYGKTGAELQLGTYTIVDGTHSVAAILDRSSSADIILNAGGTLTADSSTDALTTTGGVINMNEAIELGGSISGTVLNVSAGKLTAMLDDENTLNATGWNISQAVTNNGTLTLTGTVDATALATAIGETHIDANGQEGNSGFLKTAGKEVDIMSGSGTLVNNGTVSISGTTVTLDDKGYGKTGAELQLGTYTIVDGTHSVEAILDKSATANIILEAGTLTADASTDALTATGGTINMNEAIELGGSIRGTELNVSAGKLTATLDDANTLNATGWLLNQTITNNGTLTLTGTVDATALATVIAQTHIDANGQEGNSGFQKTAGKEVDIMSGSGTLVNNGTVSIDGTTVVLDSTGYGKTGAELQLATYTIVDGTHSVAAILDKSSSADIILNAGGTLTADASTDALTTTGGVINMNEAIELGGSISGAVLNVSAGKLTATLDDANTLNATGWQMSQTITNNGTLTLTGTVDATALATAIGETHIDANGQEGNSGFLKTAGKEVDIMTGSGTLVNNGTVSISGTTVTLDDKGYGKTGAELQLGTYTIVDGTHSVEAILGKSATANIILEAGTLTADASTDALTATGGSIEITEAATLGGSIENTAVSTASGSYSAEISAMLKGDTTLEINGGEIIVSGDNSYTGGTQVNGGTLVVSSANALGIGSVTLNGGTLEIGVAGINNTISNTGTSILQVVNGVAHVLGNTAITNSGTLTISGSFEASALEYKTETSDQRYALDGSVVSSTQSGFSMGEKYAVQIVNGGLTNGAGATIAHTSHQGSNPLVLGEDGWARANGDGSYSVFYLEGTDSLAVSTIAGVSSQHQETLSKVIMDSGSLTVDQSIAVDADGGSIVITKSSELSGTIEDTAVSTAVGNYSSEISALLKGDTTLEVKGGSITVSGDNSYSGGTVVNGGTLLAGHNKAFGAGDVTVNDASLDLNCFTIANKVRLNGNSTLGHADGASHIVLGGGSKVNFRDGFTLSAGKVLEVDAGGATYTGALTLGGGTIELDGKLTVQGDVVFESGKQTTIDISGWTSAGDGEVLVDFGSNSSGYTNDSLALSGIAGDWELKFDSATGNLVLAAVRDDFSPNLDRNQQEVYDTVKDIMGAGNPGGVLGLLGQEVAGSRDEAALKRVLDELSGREYATIMSSQMEGNMGHLRRLRAAAGTGTPLGEYVSVSYCYPSNKGVDKSDNKGASVQIAPSPVVDSRRLRAGISVFHEEGELDSDNNGDGCDRSETGAQLTMEYMVSNEFIMGMGISQSRTRLTPDYGKRRHEDNTHFDLYGVYQSGRWSTTTALGVGLHQHDLGRTVAGMQTEAEADGFSVNFLQEVAYTVWADEQQGVQVYGAVESSFNQVDSFTETGAGNASLTMDSQEAWATDVTLGLRYNHALPALDKALPGTLSLHAGVVASLGDVEETSTMRFAGAPGYSFRQGAAERNRWGYSVGVSVNLPVSANVAAFGSAEAVLRGDSYTADAQLGLKVAF